MTRKRSKAFVSKKRYIAEGGGSVEMEKSAGNKRFQAHVIDQVAGELVMPSFDKGFAVRETGLAFIHGFNPVSYKYKEGTLFG